MKAEDGDPTVNSNKFDLVFKLILALRFKLINIIRRTEQEKKRESDIVILMRLSLNNAYVRVLAIKLKA